MSALDLARLRCRRVETESELEALRRFRYRIYVEEQQKPLSYADHRQKTLNDPLDTGAWHYVCEQDDGLIIGTCRLHVAKRLPPQVETQLEITRFCSAHELPITFISKLMFAAGRRGLGAVPKLFSHCYTDSRNAGSVICFNHCSPRLAVLYVRIGLHRFGNTFQDSAVGPQVPMVHILEDEARYRETRSPLLADCLRYPNDACRVARLRDYFLRERAWQGFSQHTNHGEK